MNKTVLITGASSGLGEGIARYWLEAGWNVVLVARRHEPLAQLQKELDPIQERSLLCAADVSSYQDMCAAVEAAIKRFGRIDVLINNAAVDFPARVEELTPEQWNQIINTNLSAVFFGSKIVFPIMREQHSGLIMNISSVAGKRGWARAAAYCASKFALTGFTQALGFEGRPHNIKACVVYPGGIDSAWHAERQPTYMNPQQIAKLLLDVAGQPDNLVVNEIVITPLEEKGYP